MDENKTPKQNNCDGISVGTFTLALVAILGGSILVVLWVRFINNFTFQFLKLNENSALISFLIAIIATGVLVGYIFILDDSVSGQLKSHMSGLSFATISTTSSNIVNNEDMTSNTYEPSLI